MTISTHTTYSSIVKRSKSEKGLEGETPGDARLKVVVVVRRGQLLMCLQLSDRVLWKMKHWHCQ